MQEQNLFEYAVVRIVPQVEREEFLNIGIILYCARQRFLKAKFDLSARRLNIFSPVPDTAELQDHLNAIERICAGGSDAGTIGGLPIAERFRWLTATRSTVIQTSKVHPGFCIEAEEMLERIYIQLVL